MHKECRILMIVAQRDFRDEEFEEPKEVFQENGFKVITASERKGEALGKLGLKIWASTSLDEVSPRDYEAIVFVGGAGSSDYFHHGEALNLAREAFEAGKIIGAICIAPSILANAGILQGKRATSFSSQRENLEARGAIYTGIAVETDGKIVTANGPLAANAFGERIVELLN